MRLFLKTALKDSLGLNGHFEGWGARKILWLSYEISCENPPIFPPKMCVFREKQRGGAKLRRGENIP